MNAPVTTAELLPELKPLKFEDLAHIPGPEPTFFRTWRTIRFLRDPRGTVNRLAATYGPVFRRQDNFGWGVTLLGPEANELVLFNKDRIFSSRLGWNPVLERLFPNGLMLMDFDEHRMHRRTLSVAFKPAPMKAYLEGLNDGIARTLAGWPADRPMRFYPAIKELTLDLAAGSFLGEPWGPEAREINRAFMDMVLAAVAVVRRPLPFTQMRRGVRGRAFMCAYFAREIPKRRGIQRDDIFTHICNATHEDGRTLTDQEIIDHMNFLMMAAHDTLTSSLTSLVYFLGRHPDWQERLRAEVDAVRARHGDRLPDAALPELEECEMAFKEALRLIPPVPMIPRRAIRDFEFMGYRIPAGAGVGVNPMYTHMMPEHWPEPQKFDPERFTPQKSANRHKYAWVPFGGGAHMCLGLHFAYMQAKCFLFHLLGARRIELAPGYEADFAMVPIPRPRDGLPVTLRHR
ncbi:MAG: cytochrome P450 [Sphingomonadaceae bacterium]|uniref:cytochrome P450 n=1 Tax=Thermaurantiacus sp. TaxID=2820283 RepID=UPI00298F2B05|nr:cytochrome P450 [Thermaurantiacus sp.]MCS6987340.1 cytochrome P450 [Sphingomonadaceae bacterium]MDW8414561.1 cytochrome P450 [Thermaurantiacus sp.]